ncbi:hypothetical protein TSOC_006606 [Tetrabaena socialis]|uniref:Uncharacterized protein n=1 Tax=Tetrabaena socialis TaxID=47790 RepID=A0A2J8A3A7_9CHLO|nr:hypothetical protein TSOC_006606 [Tetrabaena socialis]|eukprot:PNH06986.1 hypothetical protein TSOC_006606 [Tetrabaena socialis]
MHKPHMAESYRKEFFAALQAKGKVPKQMTAADERRERENGGTATRIFPGGSQGGRYGAMENMIAKSEERIDETIGRAPVRNPSARQHLQARMAEIEVELQAEQQRRMRLEGEVIELRQTISRGGV